MGTSAEEAGDEPHPHSVRMRQGIPTRLDIDGERTRFAVTSWQAGDPSVRITVLRGGVNVAHRVREGDRIEAADRQWRVSMVSVPDDRHARVHLDEIRVSDA